MTQSIGPAADPKREWPWLVGAFAISFFGGGLLWWSGSYQEYLERSFSWGTLTLFAATKLILTWMIGVRFLLVAIVMGSAFPAVIMARVVIDGLQDPTRHNLWPIEIVMSGVWGMVMTLPFAAPGLLLRRVTFSNRN